MQEIGYIDKVVELRSARVKMLLGLTSEDANGQANGQTNEQFGTKASNLPHPLVKQVIGKSNEPKFRERADENEEDIAIDVARNAKPVVK